MTIKTQVAAAVGALLCAASAQASILISFTPSSQHVNIGDVVTVDMRISGLGDEILSAFDLNVLWNPAVMGGFATYQATDAFDQLGGAYQAEPILVFDTIANGNWGLQGSAVASNADVAANQADSFLLGHMTFTADANGVTTVTLGSDPDFERNFVGLDPFTSLNVTVGSACVAVGTGSCSTVPEPAGYGLAALALLGAMAPSARRRRRG